jgi:uncharacterized membrane protein
MDWDDIRSRWREDVPHATIVPIEELRRTDGRLTRAVRRRDRIETVAAVLVAAFFSLGCVVAGMQGRWIAVAFGLVVVAWAVWLPFAFRRARREVPDADPRMPQLLYLTRQRDAALVQARLLERVWLWYLTPPAVGIFGLTLAMDGITVRSTAYLAGVLALYAGLAWVNRRVARTQFRAHADLLQAHIQRLGNDID